MKKNYFLIIMGLLLVVSIAFNIKSCFNTYLVEKADTEFLSNLDSVNTSLKFINENTNLYTSIRNCSAKSGSALSLCKFTSFFEKNKGLFGTMNELNLAFINLPEDKLLKNINKISDYIIRIHNNPEDGNISDEFKQFLFEVQVSK